MHSVLLFIWSGSFVLNLQIYIVSVENDLKLSKAWLSWILKIINIGSRQNDYMRDDCVLNSHSLTYVVCKLAILDLTANPDDNTHVPLKCAKLSLIDYVRLLSIKVQKCQNQTKQCNLNK